MKMGTGQSKIYGLWQKGSSKGKVYSNNSLPQETRKISTKQFNVMTKGARKRRTNKTQSWQKERNNTDQIGRAHV